MTTTLTAPSRRYPRATLTRDIPGRWSTPDGYTVTERVSVRDPLNPIT